jgi:mannobiose 2-epimerase
MVMQSQTHMALLDIGERIKQHLMKGIIPFWLERGIDREHGGYLTCYDADGKLEQSDTDKYIVTQTRMIWGMSVFSTLPSDAAACLQACRQGVDFFIDKFWDVQHGGWYWKVDRQGNLLDDGKVVYGQSFAIYALAQYSLSTGDPRGVDYAARTFDLLQKHCADTARGGYYENLEPDWQLSAPGFHAGDRKSLDIHMHLLEAFTALYDASRLEIHRRRLEEVIDVILTHMVDPVSGCGLNQFDLHFKRIPPIAIRRTWNAEREGELAKDVPDTTSYGHNLEFIWLLQHACEVMGKPMEAYLPAVNKMSAHALAYGVDWQRGGIYRDGLHQGPALIRDKEWWQQAESLVGLLASYELTGDPRLLEAFRLTWEFSEKYLINHALGEWRTLVNEQGQVLVPGIGNPWKACYHSGRAMNETLKRLDRILA